MENMPDVFWRDDHHFLLYFIMGVCFGPDLKEGSPRKSVLQRRKERLPQYHENDLAGSHMKATVIEKVYCYLLREAKLPAVLMESYVFNYLDGVVRLPLTPKATYLRFEELFPHKLHQRYKDENQQLSVGNIVLIDNPVIWYMNTRDVKRFKELTRLEDFFLGREMHRILDVMALYNPTVQQTAKLDDNRLQSLPNYLCTKSYLDVNQPSSSSEPCSSSLDNESQVSTSSIVPLPSQINTISEEEINRGITFLPSFPSKEEWSNPVAATNGGFALTESSIRGNTEPVLGMMDIGESENSCLFRVPSWS